MIGVSGITIRRLQNVSTISVDPGRIQQPDRPLERRRTEVHVTLRRDQILVAASSWIARAGAPRIARCEQNVWRRRWTPLALSRPRRAARST